MNQILKNVLIGTRDCTLRSILRSAPSLGAEYRSAPTAPAVKKKFWWVLFGRRRGPKNFGVLFGRRRGRKIFRRTFWPPMVAKKFWIFKNCKKGRSGAKFAPLRHFVEYTPLRSARSPLEYTPLHAPAFRSILHSAPLRSSLRTIPGNFQYPLVSYPVMLHSGSTPSHMYVQSKLDLVNFPVSGLFFTISSF